MLKSLWNQLRNLMSFYLTVQERGYCVACWVLAQLQSLFPLDDKQAGTGSVPSVHRCDQDTHTESSSPCQPAWTTKQSRNNGQLWGLHNNSVSHLKPPERLPFILLLWRKQFSERSVASWSSLSGFEHSAILFKAPKNERCHYKED